MIGDGWVGDVCFIGKGDSELRTFKNLRSVCQKGDEWARMTPPYSAKKVCAYILCEYQRGRIARNKIVDRYVNEAAPEPRELHNTNNRTSVSQLRLNAGFGARQKPSRKDYGSKRRQAVQPNVWFNTKQTLEYWSDPRKATVSILIQLRTRRIVLAAYLHRINRRESARCGSDLETRRSDTSCLNARCSKTSATG